MNTIVVNGFVPRWSSGLTNSRALAGLMSKGVIGGVRLAVPWDREVGVPIVIFPVWSDLSGHGGIRNHKTLRIPQKTGHMNSESAQIKRSLSAQRYQVTIWDVDIIEVI